MNKKVQQLLSVNGLIITTAGISCGQKKGCCLPLDGLQQPGEQVLLEVLRFLFEESVEFFKLFQNIFLTCAFEQVAGFTTLRNVIGQKSRKRKRRRLSRTGYAALQWQFVRGYPVGNHHKRSVFRSRQEFSDTVENF